MIQLKILHLLVYLEGLLIILLCNSSIIADSLLIWILVCHEISLVWSLEGSIVRRLGHLGGIGSKQRNIIPASLALLWIFFETIPAIVGLLALALSKILGPPALSAHVALDLS